MPSVNGKAAPKKRQEQRGTSSAKVVIIHDDTNENFCSNNTSVYSFPKTTIRQITEKITSITSLHQG